MALRHDPLLIPGFPWLTRRRVLPLPRLRRFWLDGVGLEGRVFLDLKDARPELVDRCVAALRSAGALSGAGASTPIWAQLDYLARLAPEIDRFYSIGRGAAGAAAWRRYEERVEAGRAGAGVSMHWQSATPERLGMLRDDGLRAICYTVNDFDGGVALVEAGAGGLTTDRLELVERWRRRWS